MADKPHAIRNDINRRAREVGIFNQELTLDDLAAVRAFYSFTCLNCGKQPATSIDHVIPLSERGQNKRENLQLLCTNCNKAKGANSNDYRQGKVLTEDFVAPEQEEESHTKQRRNKVDWNAVRLQYVTGNMSLRELAEMEEIPFRTLAYQATEISSWNQQREEHRDKVATLSQQAIAEKEVNARALTFDLGVEIVNDWRRNIKRNTSAAEVAGILKILLAMQGQAAERVEHVESNVSDTELYNRILGAFDPTEEEGNITYGPVEGEEKGAGWTD